MFFSCFLQVLLSIRPSSRKRRLGGKVGTACEKFEDMRVVYWVNVSKSFGTGLPGLSWISAVKRSFCIRCVKTFKARL